jgi:hypothetical protein
MNAALPAAALPVLCACTPCVPSAASSSSEHAATAIKLESFFIVFPYRGCVTTSSSAGRPLFTMLIARSMADAS